MGPLERLFLSVAGISSIGASPARCDNYVFDVTPDLRGAPKFEVVVQYVDGHDGVIVFHVCADTSATPGDLELTVRLADENGSVGGCRVAPTPSALGRGWRFSMRSELVAHSTFDLIDNHTRLNGHNIPAFRAWKFHLGPLSQQSFHLEADWQCPEEEPQTPGFERQEINVLHLRDGQSTEASLGG